MNKHILPGYQFPKKTFLRVKSQEELEERRSKLDEFLSKMLVLSYTVSITGFYAFLKVKLAHCDSTEISIRSLQTKSSTQEEESLLRLLGLLYYDNCNRLSRITEIDLHISTKMRRISDKAIGRQFIIS